MAKLIFLCFLFVYACKFVFVTMRKIVSCQGLRYSYWLDAWLFFIIFKSSSRILSMVSFFVFTLLFPALFTSSFAWIAFFELVYFKNYIPELWSEESDDTPERFLWFFLSDFELFFCFLLLFLRPFFILFFLLDLEDKDEDGDR